MIKHHFSAGGVYAREQMLAAGQEVEKHTPLGVLPARGTLGERALLMLRGFGLRSRT